MHSHEHALTWIWTCLDDKHGWGLFVYLFPSIVRCNNMFVWLFHDLFVALDMMYACLMPCLCSTLTMIWCHMRWDAFDRNMLGFVMVDMYDRCMLGLVDEHDRCMLGFGMFDAMLIVRCMLVCVWV